MVGEDRHAKVDQPWPTIGWRSLQAAELGHRSVETDLESLDLAEPAVGAGLADAFEAYRQRNAVERCINRLTRWRGLAMRTDKLAIVYQAALHLAAILIWARVA